MLVGRCQHPSSPQPPEGRSSVPPCCCPDCSVLTPELQVWLGCSSFSCPRPEGVFPFLPRSPVSPASISELFPFAEEQPKPAAAHQLGCRQEDLGMDAASVPQHSCLFLPLGQVSGDLVLCTLISRTIQPFWGASTAVPWPAGLPRGAGLWLGGWCRLHVTFCQTLCVHLQPSSGPKAILPWVSTLVSLFPWFCTPPSPQGSPFPPWLSVAAAPAQESKGVSASKGGVLVPRPFAKEHPRAPHPWAVPGGAVELLAAELGTPRVPLPGPTSSQIT